MRVLQLRDFELYQLIRKVSEENKMSQRDQRSRRRNAKWVVILITFS